MTCPVCGAAYEEPADSCPACGSDVLPLAPGTVVAERYEIRALLGRGGMGAVYRAFDRVLHEEVALKAQRADAARDPDADRRFRNEVKLARQVTHPNVGRLHDGGREGERRWISMELVEGTTVAGRLRKGPLSEHEAWSLAVQAAEGLAAVHRAGVVHRDLKTMNMMVDPQGRLRLMDFGIAKPAAAGDTGAGGYALGSPEYMSPEQARGRPADSRSDVYSLGIVVFELFTGRVPFRADTPVATLLQHLEGAPPLDRLPEAVREVVGRALAKDPAQRYADGEAMSVALRAARIARPTAPVETPMGPCALPPIAAPLAPLATVALLAVATVAAVWLVRRNTTEGMSPGVTVPSHPPLPSATPSMTATPGETALSPRTKPSIQPPAPSPASLARPSTHPSASARPSPPQSAIPSSSPDPGRASAPASIPAQAPTPIPAPLPTTVPAPASTPTPEADGALLVVVAPWADVSIDGVPRGQTPLARIALTPGRHNVLLTHPDYQPFPRRVTIRPGETLRLAVDLKVDGVPR